MSKKIIEQSKLKNIHSGTACCPTCGAKFIYEECDVKTKRVGSDFYGTINNNHNGFSGLSRFAYEDFVSCPCCGYNVKATRKTYVPRELKLLGYFAIAFVTVVILVYIFH